MIVIKDLKKKYGSRAAIDGLSFAVEPGEIFGLLGPNGAGKTTTVRILTTLTKFDTGDVKVNGCTLPQDEAAVKASIGIVPQHFNLDGELTVRENLELHGRLYHMTRELRERRIAELLDYVELTDRADDMIRKLSGGMKRRVMIARALMHMPKVLFLDEPTVGLDVQVRRRLWDLLRRLNSQGLTVLLTTHYIKEAESLCQRVAIVNTGKMIALDTPAALCRRIGEYTVEWNDGESTQTRYFGARAQAADFAASLTADTIIRVTSLEDVFVELTGKKVGPDV